MFPFPEKELQLHVAYKGVWVWGTGVSVLQCSAAWLLTLHSPGAWWHPWCPLLSLGFLYGTWRRQGEEWDHVGSTPNKKLAERGAAKGWWHLCDCGHGGRGLVPRNLERCCSVAAREQVSRLQLENWQMDYAHLSQPLQRALRNARVGPHCKFLTRTLTNGPFCQLCYSGGV